MLFLTIMQIAIAKDASNALFKSASILTSNYSYLL
jgi:hypothetical protein